MLEGALCLVVLAGISLIFWRLYAKKKQARERQELLRKSSERARTQLSTAERRPSSTAVFRPLKPVPSEVDRILSTLEDVDLEDPEPSANSAPDSPPKFWGDEIAYTRGPRTR